MPKLAVFVSERSAREIGGISALALDAPLLRSAELAINCVSDPAVLLGAFQRASEIDGVHVPIFRRASGGPAVSLSKGVVHLALSLAHPAALTPCDAPRLVNRYVRPLLRALSSFGEKTPYFGRDWLSAAHRPVAWVGFAHDASSKRALFEAIIGVHSGWSLDRNRASFLGKSEITLDEANGRTLETSAVAEAIAGAYATAFDGERCEAPSLEAAARAITSDPEWAASVDEAIGAVAAGRDHDGRIRVGGQFMASRDAIATLEDRISLFDASTPLADIGAAVDAELTKPGVAIHGIKSLISVRDVIARALATRSSKPL
jgi:hypothetical protein